MLPRLEALANVAKHAEATGVRISVVGRTDACLSTSTTTASGAPILPRLRLRGLADRVHALDGELELESRPGSGTHVHAEMPCA